MKDLKSLNNNEKTEDLNEDDYIKFLSFKLGNEKYGIEVSWVKEIAEYDRVYKIPRIPDYIRGVINLRGDVIPVIDLPFRFYGKKSDITILSGIVIIEIEFKNKSILVGVIIDEIDAVVNIYKNNIESIPDFGAKIRADFIMSIGKVDDEFIVLLNLDNVLNIEELSQMN